jgi:hypothetical protein
VAYAEYADATDLNAAIAPRRVANSRVMRALLATVKQIASKNVNVLILGETEAGKELVASLIHGMSKRARAPLVRLNCAGIPRTSRSRSCSGRYAARSPAPTGIGRVLLCGEERDRGARRDRRAAAADAAKAPARPSER